MILKIWLGGLDSNQDNQSQSLMYCRLYDLPAGGTQEMGRDMPGIGPDLTTQFLYFRQEIRVRQPGLALFFLWGIRFPNLQKT
jgi:hypothetical protein